MNLVLNQVEQLRPTTEPSIKLNEMLDICDTEGNPQNGGGSFVISDNNEGTDEDKSVKFEPDNNSSLAGHRASIGPGEIGSPIPGSAVPLVGGGSNSNPLSSATLSSFGRGFSSPMGF